MTATFIYKTIDSRYKGETKQIIEQYERRTMWQKKKRIKKRKNINKTINTNKHIQVMIRNTGPIKTGEILVF